MYKYNQLKKLNRRLIRKVLAQDIENKVVVGIAVLSVIIHFLIFSI